MTDIQPQPDMIGGVPTPPLAVLPRPERLFRMRAERFEFLAQAATLAPYLTFLAALCRVQAGLAAVRHRKTRCRSSKAVASAYQ